MKNNCLSIFLFILLILSTLSNTFLAAQNAPTYLIKGSVTDSVSKKSIEFATISILDADKKVVALTYSDENGLFKSPNVSVGSFYLNLSFIGYGQRQSPL